MILILNVTKAHGAADRGLPLKPLKEDVTKVYPLLHPRIRLIHPGSY